MSQAVAGAAPRSRMPHLAISRGWAAGLIVGLTSGLFFSLAASRLISHGFVTPSIQALWSGPGQTTQIGGQWTQQALISLVRLIPGATVNTLVVMTVIGASLVQGFITHDLVKRGWPPLLAAFTMCLTAVHPAMLYLATNGSPMLLYCIAASFTIIALDRMEAIGDTQSLIVMGLAIAVVLLTWPNAIFFILPLLALLPVAFRDGRSAAAIGAMYIIVAAPSMIMLAAVAIGGTLFEVSWSQVAAIWSSPLHGGMPDIVAQSAWLLRFGGHPIAAFFQLILVCALVMPRLLVIPVRFVSDSTERKRPATGLAALFLPIIAGGLASWFWQIASPWIVVGLALTCSSAWATTVRFRKWERWLWMGVIIIGVTDAWTLPLLWLSPDLMHWRDIILAPL